MLSSKHVVCNKGCRLLALVAAQQPYHVADSSAHLILPQQVAVSLPVSSQSIPKPACSFHPVLRRISVCLSS
jgi:hypothetical protein